MDLFVGFAEFCEFYKAKIAQKTADMFYFD